MSRSLGCCAGVVLALFLSGGKSSVASAQSIAQNILIDKDFPLGEPLEKAIDYFVSRSFPSVVIGNGRGGLYLYWSKTQTLQGPWVRSTIASRGGAYERARPIKFAGDAYPNVVASIGNKIIWFDNPMNHGNAAGLKRAWAQHIINPDHGCHDIRIEDLDGDGKIDVICSGSISLRAPQFVAFQDDRDHWKVVYNVADVGDGIAILRIGTGTLPHLVGADLKGNIYWYENPRLNGQDARTSGWVKHYIGPGNVGNSFAAGRISSDKDSVITAANEHEGPGGITDVRGLTWYEQPDNAEAPWIAHSVDASYRDVHEVNLGEWKNGTPYIIVAEQEQACEPARPENNPPTHPGTPCRISMFEWAGGSLRQFVLAETSTQNQAVLPWRDGLLMADANHGVYGGSRAIHVRLILP